MNKTSEIVNKITIRLKKILFRDKFHLTAEHQLMNAFKSLTEKAYVILLKQDLQLKQTLLNKDELQTILTSHLEKASHCQTQGKFNEGLRACNQALAIDPENIAAYHIRGLIYYSLDNFEGARKDWQKVSNLQTR